MLLSESRCFLAVSNGVCLPGSEDVIICRVESLRQRPARRTEIRT